METHGNSFLKTLLLFFFIPGICLAQQNRSNVSKSLNISGLFDTSKPVIQIEYEQESPESNVLMVDVLVTITDNEGLDNIVMDEEVIQMSGQHEYRKVIKTPNEHNLAVTARDINGNQAEATSFINVTSLYVASKKLALVIGNSQYEHSAPLRNPRNDARAMASTLRDLDFEVISVADVTKAEMENALKKFSARLKDMEVALFYYAGHGMQMKGKNYLIPVDAKYENGESDVEFESINLFVGFLVCRF